MKKQFKVAGITVLALIGLVGCSEEVTTKEVKQVESKEVVKEAPVKEEAPKDIKEYNKDVINSAKIAARLVSMEHIVNAEWEEDYYEVIYEVDNKTDAPITIQYASVSADGKMIQDDLLIGSQDIEVGKKADFVLTIDTDGGKLPEITKNFEMNLEVLSEEYDLLEEHKVVVDFK